MIFSNLTIGRGTSSFLHGLKFDNYSTHKTIVKNWIDLYVEKTITCKFGILNHDTLNALGRKILRICYSFELRSEGNEGDENLPIGNPDDGFLRCYLVLASEACGTHLWQSVLFQNWEFGFKLRSKAEYLEQMHTFPTRFQKVTFLQNQNICYEFRFKMRNKTQYLEQMHTFPARFQTVTFLQNQHICEYVYFELKYSYSTYTHIVFLQNRQLHSETIRHDGQAVF